MTTAIRIVVALVTLTCWVMTFYKLRDLVRDPRNQPLRALWVALATITLSLSIQPIAPRLDQLVGSVDFGRVLSNCLTLISAAAAQAFLLYMRDLSARTGRLVRLQYAIMTGCVIAIVLLYVVQRPPYAADDPYVLSGEYYQSGTPLAGPAWYTYVYLTYLGWSMLAVSQLSVHYARIATRPLMRGGLRLITIGSLIALVYCALKLITGVFGHRDEAAAVAADRVMIACFTLSILLILIGSTMPSWGTWVGLDRLWETAAAWSANRRLRPLWTVMYEVAPQISLMPEPTGLAALRQARDRLVRVTVEILDGYALLGPWMDAQVEQTARAQASARGLTGADADAAVEAQVLLAAADVHRRGVPAGPDDDPARPVLPHRDAAADTDASAEVAWLIRVARALPAAAAAPATAPAPAPHAGQ
jgi:hypothetical protein